MSKHFSPSELPLCYVIRPDVQKVLYDLLNQQTEARISGKAAYICAKIGNKMTQATLKYEEKRLALVEIYGDRDESGQLIWEETKDENGLVTNRKCSMSPENRELFNEDMKQVLVTPAEVYKINPILFEELHITDEAKEVLKPLILEAQ